MPNSSTFFGYVTPESLWNYCLGNTDDPTLIASENWKFRKRIKFSKGRAKLIGAKLGTMPSKRVGTTPKGKRGGTSLPDGAKKTVFASATNITQSSIPSEKTRFLKDTPK